MTRLTIGLLIGLGLGAAVSTDAQTSARAARPCASSWIVWERLVNPRIGLFDMPWEAVAAYPTRKEAAAAAARRLEGQEMIWRSYAAGKGCRIWRTDDTAALDCRIDPNGPPTDKDYMWQEDKLYPD